MLEYFVKSLFRFVGLDVSRRTSSFPDNPFNAQKMLLAGIGIKRPVIFDIGGHRGESVKQYRARFPDASVYCFEPSPDSLAYLNKNFGDDPQTNIIPLAVSDQSGQRTFFINEIDATNSLLPIAKTSRRYLPGKGDSKAAIQVNTTSIDEFVISNDLDEIHILKMDIQGGELSALKGAEKTFAKQQIPLVFTEIMFIPHYENQPLLNDIWNFLSRYGYTFFDMYYPQRAKNGQVRYADALFVSSDVRKRVIDA